MFMKISKINAFANYCFLLILSLSACAQDYANNSVSLNAFNAVANSTVLLNNEGKMVPLMALDKKKIASVNFNFTYASAFDSLLNKYTAITTFNANRFKTDTTLSRLKNNISLYNTIIFSLSDQETKNQKYIDFITETAKTKQVVVALFGDGFSLKQLDTLQSPIIWSQQNTAEAAVVVPQIIFGGIAAEQKLQQNFSAKFVSGCGDLTAPIRLKYTVPEDAGIKTDNLKEIDNIANEAIKAKATPGLVVLVAKDGKVIFNKAYGTHTYNSGLEDKVSDIFDLASVTKIAATTPTVMRLVEENKLNLDECISAYIPKANNSPMCNIKVREVMLHQAGFIPYIPFYEYVKPSDHSTDSSALYSTKVADHYYINKNYFKDIMWPKMLYSPIKTRGQYVYSDISMYVMKAIVEQLSGEPLNQYVEENFYAPLGMQTAGFLPLNKFPKSKIIPTEDDTYFRKDLLDGYVHDQGAALVGGVSGHAGLFASANDMAILYQMLLNKGQYGGQHFFSPKTVENFTARQSNISRRGLGFDRWDPDTTKKYPSELASPQTYGHTGYTGTCVWVDPANNLVYVFLSNRVNPKVTNTLSNLKIRGRIQDVVYRAIEKGL